MPILTTAHIARPATASSPLSGFLTAGAELLAQEDPQLHGAVCAEHAGQEATLSLLADTGVVDPSVLACMASVTRSVDHLGELGTDARAGIERLAARRAREVFHAGYANVLPASPGLALAGVLDALGVRGDAVLDLRGELAASTMDGRGQLRVAEIAELAERVRPAVLVCGGRHAPAGIDYPRLRAAADAVRAVLVADVTSTAGQLAVGAAPNPVPHAHVTIAGTHRQLFGPHGAVVLTAAHDELAEAIAATLTWSWPGASSLPAVAGKARALHLTGSEQFRDTVRRMRAGATQLAGELAGLGHLVRAGEFADHVVLVGLPERFAAAEPALAGLRVVNLTAAAAPPGLTDNPALRLGTATLAARQFGSSEVRQTAELLDSVLGATRRDGTVDEFVRLSAFDSVRRLLSQFPLPCYVPVTQWEDYR
jgi:glycine hydroxymethyltransferase